VNVRSLAGTLALIFVAAPLLARAAKADDWKFDPKKKRKHAVGDKTEEQLTQQRKIKVKITAQQQIPGTDQDQRLTLKVVKEVLAVSEDGSKITKSKLKVVKFELKEGKDGEADTSLEGKTITIERDGDSNSAKIDDETGVSDQAKRWVETELAKGDKDNEKMDDAIFPKEPIAPDTEWKADPNKVSKALFDGAECDKEASSATGKLSSVRVDGGLHWGLLEITMKLKLKKFPQSDMDWKDGGVLEMVMSGDGALDKESSEDGTIKVDMKLKGTAEQDAGDGNKMTIDFSMTMKQEASVKTIK